MATKFMRVQYEGIAAYASEILALGPDKKPISKYDHNRAGDSVVRQGASAPTIFTFPGLADRPLNARIDPVDVPAELWARMKEEDRYVKSNLTGDHPMFVEMGEVTR